MAIDTLSVFGADTASSSASSARVGLADDYNTFLVLLTSQLQNQDPLSPMDSTEFTSQLVQYSQVEQQIKTNENLEDLVGHYEAASAGAALSYLGKEAMIEGSSTYLSGGAANWTYSLPQNADSVTLSVRDQAGRTVYQTDGSTIAGTHSFDWNGEDNNGVAQSDGVYSLHVNAKDSAGEAINPTIIVRERITGVDFSGGTPLVITPSGSRSIDQIRAISDADSSR